MALPLGKLTLLVGAGIVGSVLAKEGRMSDVSNFFSGAFKIALKQLKQDDSTSPTVKPKNDALLAQVNSLRQELQILASNRSITIVTASGTGKSKYGVVVIIVVVGYGYAWWKGWKLPDMMFATRRSLSDACSSISKQLENVYSSIAATKRHLSSRIDRVDCSIDEFAELTSATKEEVFELRGGMKMIGGDVASVQKAVQNLESKIIEIEGKQDITNEGLGRLCHYAWNLENSRTTERIQASPSSSFRPALELRQTTPPLRTESLPPTVPSLEPPPSPSNPSNSNRSPKPPLQNAAASGLKELDGISKAAETTNTPEVSNGIGGLEETRNGSSGSGLFGVRLSYPSFITRTRSATQAFASK